MGRVVLVTGASRYLGAQVAEALAREPGVDRVIGVDPAPPRHPLGRAEFALTGLHDDGVSRVVRESGADTVLHLGLTAALGGARGRAAMRENNVLGAMQLLSACQRSHTVRRLVVRSSAAVYGFSRRDPGPSTEDLEARRLPRSAYAQDAAEIELHTRGLARRRPDMSVAVLRFANVIGPATETPLTRYLGLRFVPMVRGYDPRMQFLHEDDGAEAVRLMALGDRDGVFNVAAPGSLPLSQCLRRVRGHGLAVPERGLKVFGGLARRTRLGYSPDQLRVLCNDRVLDATKLERALGWTPAYSSQEAFESFLAGGTPGGPVRGRRDGHQAPRMHAALGR
ncbi:NAD-dependent epimerase/dehydratase family protein [Nocardiopsis mangrovi]|uniref:NAD-dependent epimerase/dehydratase family protein n=1 Tax=Nocardiopsis mangrovi TaxID=1179818 RepID=A0ABV9DUV6_9ACTN